MCVNYSLFFIAWRSGGALRAHLMDNFGQVAQTCAIFYFRLLSDYTFMLLTAKKQSRPTVKTRKGFLIWPAKGTLTSRFGMRNGRKHEGIDIGAPKGTPVRAAASGQVVFSGWGPTGYGKMIIIKHQHHLTTLYAHNSKLIAKKGTRVKQGQKISLIGSTGRSTGPHLHFEVRNNTHAKDPIKYLPIKR